MANIVSITTSSWNSDNCATPTIAWGYDDKENRINRPEWYGDVILYDKVDTDITELALGREHATIDDQYNTVLMTVQSETHLDDMLTEHERSLRKFAGDATYKRVRLGTFSKIPHPGCFKARGVVFAVYGGKDV